MRAVVCALCFAGCGAYQARQLELCHPETGCRPRPFWPDADADGWGEMGATPRIGVDPLEGEAANQMDCDDTRPEVTADTAGLCPSQFEGPGDVVGRVDPDLEYVVVIGTDTEGVGAPAAEDICGTPGWGGAIGALPNMVQALSDDPSVWVASSPDELGPEWADQPGRQDLSPGPVLWGPEGLAGALQGTLAHVACVRPRPDPADHQTPAAP